MAPLKWHSFVLFGDTFHYKRFIALIDPAVSRQSHFIIFIIVPLQGFHQWLKGLLVCIVLPHTVLPHTSAIDTLLNRFIYFSHELFEIITLSKHTNEKQTLTVILKKIDRSVGLKP